MVVSAPHDPFAMLHCTTVLPTVNAVIVVTAEVEDVITPPPDKTLQIPTPTVGTLPIKLALPVLTQITPAEPAIGVVGTSST